MATIDINTRLKNKRDLEVNWRAASFVPLPGEIIIYAKEVDASGNVLTKLVDGQPVSLLPVDRIMPYTYDRIKLGDGVTNINDLPFLDNNISCGTEDPDATTLSQFYFKYSN
jgi:hypothetical protein